jgi:hypothetical protein
MSFNLTLRVRESELWQTPTWVTLMCLSYNPKTTEPDGGHEGVSSRFVPI